MAINTFVSKKILVISTIVFIASTEAALGFIVDQPKPKPVNPPIQCGIGTGCIPTK